MLKSLFLLIGFALSVAALPGSHVLNADATTTTVVSGIWATSYPSFSTSTQPASTQASIQPDPIDDPGRLWVTYRRYIPPQHVDPNFRLRCEYDIFESRASVDPFNVCLHPYKKIWLVGIEADCDQGYRMPIPTFPIGFDPCGVSTGCFYQPDGQKVVCDNGEYPCLIVNQENNWVQCADNKEDPGDIMSGYGAYARLQCDGFPTQ
ncbi:hypothetical protein B0T21DRAFT_385755 [Apiosordaria backusii]|uniref:Uncharacterized protein n=1 Tax=Apiosordaria backusii TaxID=314023 RepID=A0AA40B2L6_9PEZI|nr:hypothetical protein B0T21DRAFT_385755 [Apiosordaria backusii]